jgi:hypothetical protein
MLPAVFKFPKEPENFAELPFEEKYVHTKKKVNYYVVNSLLSCCSTFCFFFTASMLPEKRPGPRDVVNGIALASSLDSICMVYRLFESAYCLLSLKA